MFGILKKMRNFVADKKNNSIMKLTKINQTNGNYSIVTLSSNEKKTFFKVVWVHLFPDDTEYPIAQKTTDDYSMALTFYYEFIGRAYCTNNK